MISIKGKTTTALNVPSFFGLSWVVTDISKNQMLLELNLLLQLLFKYFLSGCALSPPLDVTLAPRCPNVKRSSWSIMEDVADGRGFSRLVVKFCVVRVCLCVRLQITLCVQG